ncbi:MAG: dynamin family protein [Bacilli bacterium]|nr:dynamin family protein [Bacilli bacterium]
MGLFDVDDYIEERNSYLEDYSKGLELISKVLGRNKINKVEKINIDKINTVLDRDLLRAFKNVQLTNEMEIYTKLTDLSDKISEQNKVKLLNDRTIIGIGGKFSSGKSKFINSLLDDDILPEKQNPTTSIPTYIISNENDTIKALTFNNMEIELDLEAMQALTHEFYEKYNIGFSSFIKNLIIQSKNMMYKNIAFLDTPGYTKYDLDSKKSISDEEKARLHLKASDYVIWLVDAENGEISQKDIEFLKSIAIETKVLVVFNKADKKTENDIYSIVKNSENTLNVHGIKYFGVTAYSALDGEEYLGNKKIEEFLNEAQNYKNSKENIEKQINDILSLLEKQINDIENKSIERRNKLGNIIFKSDEFIEIKTLTKMYSDSMDYLRDINKCKRNFKQIKSTIKSLLDEYFERR